MKTKFLQTSMLAIFLAFTMFMGTSCSDDDDDKNPSLKVSVDNIKGTSATISWNLVSDMAFAHEIEVVNNATGAIEFTDITGLDLSTSTTVLTIDATGLTPLTEYTANITAASILDDVLGSGNTTFTTIEQEAGDDDGAGSGSVEFADSDIVGRWETSNMYYTFNDDKSGEYGQPSEIFGDEKLDDFTWEAASFTYEEMDMTTFEFIDKNASGIRAKDSEGYYTDFEVVKNDDGSFTLIDHTNDDTYSKIDDGASDGDDDGGGDDNADQGDMIIESVTLPGVFEAEYFMNGGQGIGYNDDDTINNGTATIRVSGVDIHPHADASNGYRVGWTNEGEWLKFKGSIETGEYLVKVTYSGEGTIGITLAGVYKEMDLPATGDHDIYNTITIYDAFSIASSVAEAEVLKAKVVVGGFDIDKFEIIANDGSTEAPYKYEDFIGEWKGGAITATFYDDKTVIHDFGEGSPLELVNARVEDYVNSTGEAYGWCLVVDWELTPGSFFAAVVYQIESKDKIIHKGGLGDTELTRDGEVETPELVFYPSSWETTDANGITDKLNIVSAEMVDFYGGYGTSSEMRVEWTASFDESSKTGHFYEDGNDVGEFTIDENNVMTFWNDDWTKILK